MYVYTWQFPICTREENVRSTRCAISQAAVPSIQVVFVVRVHYAGPGALKFGVLGCIRFGHFAPLVSKFDLTVLKISGILILVVFQYRLASFRVFRFLICWGVGVVLFRSSRWFLVVHSYLTDGQTDRRTHGR